MSAVQHRSVGVLAETADAAASMGSTSPFPSSGEVAPLLRTHVAGTGRVLTRPRPGEEPAVDHIVVSSAGVDIVQVHQARGRIGIHHLGASPYERALYVDGVDRTTWLTELDATTAEVRDALGRSPLARLRRGWLCIEGADWREVPTGVRLAGYVVLPPSLLRQFLPVSGTFGTAHITVAATRLEHHLDRTHRAVVA